ncbi:hypothetical protein AD006_29420 (plasmid) [Pseudonocardia sp. EC080610-09]|nr:hypothetical protein AD006_29420 [Pseudonocardia sp. EC080610-09]ALL85648.1 hypothetical protein AD017_31830 [Pseudonocardia sp. EC080619-01]
MVGAVTLLGWLDGTHDVVWTVAALLALPLMAAGTVVHDDWSALRTRRSITGSRRRGSTSEVSAPESVQQSGVTAER